MTSQRARAAAIAAATLGLVLGATVATAGGAEAAARPNVANGWSCESLSSISNPGGVVVGQACTGSGSGPGWIGVTGGAQDLCQSFTAVRRLGIYYAVTGTTCQAG
jgi:hypothetical protein